MKGHRRRNGNLRRRVQFPGERLAVLVTELELEARGFSLTRLKTDEVKWTRTTSHLPYVFWFLHVESAQFITPCIEFVLCVGPPLCPGSILFVGPL